MANVPLELLLARAENISLKGETNSDLARQLRLALTQTYGTESRDSSFINGIQLAMTIDEKDNKKWSTNEGIIGQGAYLPQTEGLFTFSHYIGGKIDLSLDNKLMNRIYGILIAIEPISLKTRNNYDFDSLNVSGNQQKKRERAAQLRSFLEKNLRTLFTFYIALEPAHKEISSVDYSRRGGEPRVEIDFSSGEEFHGSMAQARRIFELNLGEFIGNIHQVGRVHDGGSRYRR